MSKPIPPAEIENPMKGLMGDIESEVMDLNYLINQGMSPEVAREVDLTLQRLRSQMREATHHIDHLIYHEKGQRP